MIRNQEIVSYFYTAEVENQNTVRTYKHETHLGATWYLKDK